MANQQHQPKDPKDHKTADPARQQEQQTPRRDAQQQGDKHQEKPQR